MASSSAVSYTNKDFLSIRTDLINYVKQYYPDSFSDFTENDLGILFIELIAGLGDSLNYQIDRKYQETQLEFAQQRKSIRLQFFCKTNRNHTFFRKAQRIYMSNSVMLANDSFNSIYNLFFIRPHIVSNEGFVLINFINFFVYSS